MQTECAICYEELGDLQNYNLDDCGHTFHTSCIVKWFREGNSSCPICRDVGSEMKLCWPDSQARATALRRKARSSKAPIELKRLVKNVQTHEKAYTNFRAEYNKIRKDHKEVFKKLSNIRTKMYAASRKKRQSIRILGTFSSPNFPLPNIRQ